MPTTSPAKLLLTLARAAGKAATARLRGAGLTAEYADWAVRAEVCERCPLRVVQCGKSYCGQPLLRRVVRDPAVDGCGCPTRSKAKDPTEHCPITPRHESSARPTGAMSIGMSIGLTAGAPTGQAHSDCPCKWCVAVRPQILPAAA